MEASGSCERWPNAYCSAWYRIPVGTDSYVSIAFLVICISEISYWTGGLEPECERSTDHTGRQLCQADIAQCPQQHSRESLASGLLLFCLVLL
jgi:hypothetical protein